MNQLVDQLSPGRIVKVAISPELIPPPALICTPFCLLGEKISRHRFGKIFKPIKICITAAGRRKAAYRIPEPLVFRKEVVDQRVVDLAAGCSGKPCTEFPTLRRIPGMRQLVDHRPVRQICGIQSDEILAGETALWDFLQADAQVLRPVPEPKIIRRQAKEQETGFFQDPQSLVCPYAIRMNAVSFEQPAHAYAERG